MLTYEYLFAKMKQHGFLRKEGKYYEKNLST